MDFQENIRELLYAHNDTVVSNECTVELLEKLTREYIRDLTQLISESADIKGKLDDECILFSLRRDHNKYSILKNRIRKYDSIEKMSLVSGAYRKNKKRKVDIFQK